MAANERWSREAEARAEKKALRGQILRERDALGEQERRRGAVLLTERILGHQWFYLSDTVLGFASFGSEIETDGILEEALRKGKALYLPRVEGEQMHFYRVYDLRELRAGYKGIREPVGEAARYACDGAELGHTLMLMPGVAFDPYRNRLGYGKGFYDRFLADKPGLQLRTIGVGFSCQMTARVPAGEGDIGPYQVICV